MMHVYRDQVETRDVAEERFFVTRIAAKDHESDTPFTNISI